ncbi:hypothetical protein EWM64_g2231 [Hericium alpestre]|uniref:Uncharacterized protein n=1 Tax=Hericium alpestre TaxID=135208 RepID=A0A4Z0A4Z1_9AGAM|nr:hypothetical protein EWM64_g2231 [Hericium alpestre]
MLLISFFSNLGDRSIDIKLWRTCDAVDAAVPTYHLYNSECDISLQFPISLESTGPLEALCQVLPLDDLRVLSVNGYHGSWSGSWPAQSWINMFGRCRAVERVDVNHGIAVQFCKALVLPVGCSPTASGAPQTLDQLFLRELRSLTISNLNFSIITGEDNKQFINELMILLRQRADYCQNAIGPSGGSDVEAVDRRLARFSILSCSIGQNQVSDLAEVVQDIVWDNHEGEYGVPAEPNWDVYEDMESDGGASEDEDVGSAGSQADSDSSEGF